MTDAAHLLSDLLGFIISVIATLELGYTRGELIFSSRGVIGNVNYIFVYLDNPQTLDLHRWAVWLLGFFEAAALAFLRARYYWFPFHPVGLSFQWTIVAIVYWSTLMLVWLTKLIILRFGGIRAYVAGKPFFYGLGIGYVSTVILSVTVDLIWFPTAGHKIHGW